MCSVLDFLALILTKLFKLTLKFFEYEDMEPTGAIVVIALSLRTIQIPLGVQVGSWSGGIVVIRTTVGSVSNLLGSAHKWN